MKSFDTRVAMDIIAHSSGGFSYDTLARAMISIGNSSEYQNLLDDCKIFCLLLEEGGVLRRCSHSLPQQDEYFEYIHH